MTKASVVINTFNRASYLPNAMLSIASQSHANVELIVVNGPSTDATESVLDALQAQGMQFKRAACESRNLSESRNIGIAHASGDVVFFIDDDAVAHREWVERLMRQYADPEVGAAGGFTFDHTGVSFQCRYTVCDRLGNARFFDTLNPEYLLTHTNDFYFPSLLGTNCSFSMRTLRRIGGFDEVFAYMLDETDVCLRIFDLGRRIVTVPDAYVFHKYAPSHTRTAERLPNSLLAPARSKVYYCLKHATKARENSLDVFVEVDRYKQDIEFANRWYLDHKKIAPDHYTKISKELAAGIAEGLKLGLDQATKFAQSRHLVSRAGAPGDFLPVVKLRPGASPGQRPLKIYFVSQGYPPIDTSGIARWTCECARSLTALGHEVHVITRSATSANHVDFVAGVWVHSVVDLFEDELAFLSPTPIPASIARRAGAVLREIRRSEPIWGVDIVSAPIWDVEGILCTAYLHQPVVTSLHTTYKLALPFKPEWTTNRDYRANHIDKVIRAEAWLLDNAPMILANSREVVSEIDGGYGGVLARRADRLVTVAHGLGSTPSPAPLAAGGAVHGAAKGRLKLLFVGRIEARKGPDQLLAALLQIPRVLDNAEIVLVGKSPGPSDPYVRQVIALADKLRAKCPRAEVRWLGHVDDAELDAHYASADVFVAPSRFESFGLILIEAMRHGVAVVAGNIGGMREIITDGVDGCLFDIDNLDQLVQTLKALIESPERRTRLGLAGLATYEKRFTSAVMGASLEQFFYRTLECPRA